jgi:hypothetical protein
MQKSGIRERSLVPFLFFVDSLGWPPRGYWVKTGDVTLLPQLDESTPSLSTNSLSRPKRRFPLAPDRIEPAPRVVDALRRQLPAPLASELHVAHQAGVGQHLQVLGHALAADVGRAGQLGDRQQAARAQQGDQPQPGRVAQGREDLGQARVRRGLVA